jgi:hypothetical protein
VGPLDRFRLLEQTAAVFSDLRSRLDCRLAQLAAAVEFVRQRKSSESAQPQFEDDFIQAVAAAVGECGQILNSGDGQEEERASTAYFMLKVKLSLLLYDDLECVQAVLQDCYGRSV